MPSLVGSSLMFYHWIVGKGQRHCSGSDRGVILGAEVSNLPGGKVDFFCRMDSDSDSYYVQVLENEKEVEGPLNINVNLNLEESPESPPQGSPSPVPPHPIPVEEPSLGGELRDDGNNFMNCYTQADVLDLKSWAQETRNRLNEEGYVVEAPVISQNFLVFLQENHGKQWELKFLRPAAEPVFEQMTAYVDGYARLTSHNKYLLGGLFETWSVEEKVGKLRLLAESGGLLESD